LTRNRYIVVDLAAVGADLALAEERVVGRRFLHLGDDGFGFLGAGASTAFR
jgi:hypothetical protein